MRSIFFLSFLLLPGLAQADTFILKDGAKIEGEVTGEMDGAVLVKTRYGSLTINRTDIKEQQAAIPPAAPAAAPAAAPVAASTAALVVIDSAPVTAAPDFEPLKVRLTFTTVQPSTSTHSLVY